MQGSKHQLLRECTVLGEDQSWNMDPKAVIHDPKLFQDAIMNRVVELAATFPLEEVIPG